MRRSRILLFVCVAFVSLAGASAAAAAGDDSPQPPSGPALSQYVEQIPTAGGSVASGFGSGKAGHLSTRVRKQLSRLSPKANKLLTTVATSRQYGAPAEVTKPVVSRAGVKPRVHVPAAPKIDSTASALADSIDAGGLSGVVGLGIVLLLSLIVLVGTSLLRRREAHRAGAPWLDPLSPPAKRP